MKSTATSQHGRVVLFPHQKEAIEKLRSGSILCGGVGSGKSIAAIAYYYTKVCDGVIGVDGKLSAPKTLKPLYVITTARKRDTLEWEAECNKFGMSAIVDSWNNIHKYESVVGCVFLFDEQRVVGSGSWVKSFLKIVKANHWLLLSATPGDTWLDYIPVFIANGFYKNRTQFLSRHAIYNRFSKFPKVDRFVDCGQLEAFRRRITVVMDYKKITVPHHINIVSSYDKALYEAIVKDRWDPYKDEPIKDISMACYVMRKVVNSDFNKLDLIRDLMKKHPRIIVFYNYDYELERLKELSPDIEIKEWNGHRHEPVPTTGRWLYLVQYMAGAEAWNCITTDTIVFFSQNYSYKMMTQAAGRIDRLNSPYTDLYYYHIRSDALIDQAIERALKGKKNFNELLFIEQQISR